MILDSQELFSSAQALAVGTGDTASTNVLDTGAAHDEGIGERAYINVLVTTAFTSGGAATVQAVVQTSADNSTWADVMSGPALAYNAAGAAAGQYLLQAKLPIGLQRYVRVAYRVGTAALTAGAASAFITEDIQKSVNYATSITVL